MSTHSLPPWEDIEVDTTLISKLQAWLVKQPGLVAPVSEAAAHFKVPRERIEQAAGDGYWMFLTTYDGVPHVGVDGE